MPLDDNIEVEVEMVLIFPFEDSLSHLIDFSNIWKLFLLQCCSKKSFVKAIIPSKIFKTIFGKNPKIGQEYISKMINRWVKKTKVIKITIKKEKKDDKNTRSKQHKNGKKERK